MVLPWTRQAHEQETGFSQRLQKVSPSEGGLDEVTVGGLSSSRNWLSSLGLSEEEDSLCEEVSPCLPLNHRASILNGDCTLDSISEVRDMPPLHLL